MISESLSVNKKGHLTIGGVDTVSLVKKYGTPLYVMDENLIIKTCRRYQNAIKKYYGANGYACYANKAFCTSYVCALISELGLGVDVVSGGELYTSLKAGVDIQKIFFHGNNKTDYEMNLAVENNIGFIVVDNLEELKKLSAIAKKQGRKVDILLRITPGVKVDTHASIQTGQIDSKFGFSIETGAAMEAVSETLKYKNLNLRGIHSHIGSQILAIEPFILLSKIMLGFIKQMREKFGLEPEILDLGGGYGIQYTEEDNPADIEQLIQNVCESITETCSEEELKLPTLILEPGRSIVAPAGITLYTVGSVKSIPNIRTYVAVDGGMTDNPRFALYGAKYTFEVANAASEPKDELVTIAGRCCESGDLLGQDVRLQKVKAGDILAALATGGYSYSMASNYNRVPRPPVVFVKDGSDKLVIKRETYDDLIKNDIL